MASARSACLAFCRVLGAAIGVSSACDVAANGSIVVSEHLLAEHVAVGESFMAYRHLGSLQVDGSELEGKPLVGLSALQWDEDEQLLYALSDTGWLNHLQPVIKAGVLRSVNLVGSYRLRDTKGRPLLGNMADSEGLAGRNTHNGITGDSRLFISFERRPRVIEYAPDGRAIEQVKLPRAWSSSKFYKTPNRSLESVSVHPVFGLLTGPELPPRNAKNAHTDDNQATVPIIALKQANVHWDYPLYNAPNSSLVAMRSLPDGSLLTLERGYGLFYLPITIVLRKSAPLDSARHDPGPITDLAVLDSSRGWHLDNFEGLAAHGANKYFMVSDDNGQSFLQRTLLTYFELIEPAPAVPVPQTGAESTAQ